MQSLTEEWPAPIRGWFQSGNLAAAGKDQAEVLDNFFPLSQGVRLRKGCVEFADLGASVRTLFTYSATSDAMFGATDTAVFDVERVVVSGNTFAEMEGFTSGDWTTTQMSTTGGNYMVAVNGTDNAWHYNGTDYQPLVDEAIINLGFDAQTSAFAIGATITGGTSGATAEVHGIVKSSATAGTLKLGTITGVFQDNETITDGATGSATSNIPSGTSSATAIAITGIATSALSQAWNFKERLFFVEKGTLSVWYLPTKNIGGAASEINLGAVFRKGGAVLFGATWSVDSGSGLDDVCVFVTTNGEIAIYQGTDPSSASTWSLGGVYEVGEPLNKHAYVRTGADLAILTDDGIVPISAALTRDRVGLQVAALTYPIEDAWKRAVADSQVTYPISATLWQKQTLLMIGIPTTDNGINVCYISNSRTGAWARYTGWDVRCSTVSSDKLYFGSNDGIVYQAETGGNDAGTAYTGICVPKFSSQGPNNKFLTRAQIITKAATKPVVKLVGLTNYEVPEISTPTPTPVVTTATWGVGVWGTFVWGSPLEQNVYSVWKKIRGSGFSVSIGALVTSNNTNAADVEIVAMKARYEAGSIL